jgi:glycosyltransferase involved in cell wall biosynthesis
MNNRINNNEQKQKDTLLVFLFSAWYPTEFNPFLGNFVQNHAKAIGKFAKVLAIHPYEDILFSQKQLFFIEEKQFDGITEIRVKYKGVTQKGYLGKLIRFLRERMAYRKGVSEAIRKYGYPDISHVNVLNREAREAIFLKRKFKIPFILTEHWTKYLPENGEFKGFFQKKFARHVAKQADAITTVSAHLGKAMQFHKLYNRNYRVVPNVFDENLFRPFISRTEKKNILHVSSLNYKQKNFAGILRAINKIAEKRNDFLLHVVHDSDNSDYLSFIKEHRLEDTVIFHGGKSGEELVKHFNQADFFLLFSNFENLPCVIIESFACGKPVISTNVGGVSEIVNEERGILLERGNEDSLVAAIDYMLDNHQQYDSAAIREYALQHFSEETIGKMFFLIYQQILYKQ